MDVFIHQRFDGIYRRHPLVLVDVGARGGLKSNWAPARRHLRLLGFEPDHREFSRLMDRARSSGGSDKYFNTALHNRPGPITLHVARDGGLSSIFRPNRDFLDTFPEADRFDTVDVRQVEADTLDNVLAADGVTDVDFVKADTQGSELHVLQGGSNVLAASVIGVEAEVEFAPIYSDQPLFADVDAFLRSLGYLLFGLRPCYWKRASGRAVGGPRGQMIWADALYLRSIPHLQRSIATLEPAAQASKLLRAISVSLLYGYFDYALEIARQSGDVIDPEDRAMIEAQLREAGGHQGPLARFPGRRRLAIASHWLWKVLVQRDDAWSVSDAKLGN
ncbi:MAG: FkbM family methyltransferase [Vicinamibacterales bacterium]